MHREHARNECGRTDHWRSNLPISAGGTGGHRRAEATLRSSQDFVVGEAAVEALPDLDTFTVAFAERPGGRDRQLHLQVALKWHDQDVRLGQDTYCLVDKVGAAVYGGVVKCSVTGRELRLHLSPSAAEALSLPTVLRLYLDELDIDLIDRIRHGLVRVFDVPRNAPVLEGLR